MKTLPQQLLDGEGQRFGDVQVVVDEKGQRCAYQLMRDDHPKHIVQLDTLDEINGASATHTHLAGGNEFSASIVAALRFAASAIRNQKWGRS